MDGRDELKALLTLLRPGDEVFVLRLDRLARSMRDFLDIARAIEEKGATLHCILQPIETKTAAGRMFIHMLAAFSVFETELRKERQLAGITKARAARRYEGHGRKPSYDRAVISHMFFERKKKPSEIAKHLGCTEWTVRRALAEIKAKQESTTEKEKQLETSTQV